MFGRICVLLLLLVSGLSGQQPPNVRVQSNVVIVPVLVKDAEGHIVYGLTENDFVIDDDGVEQAVRLDEAAESTPTSVVVAVQTGRRAWREYSSMRGIGPMLTPVFDQLHSRVALVEFDSHVQLIEDFSEDAAPIYDDLKKLQPVDNGAAIRDVVDFSVRLLEKEPADRQRVLLLISENRDHGSHSRRPMMWSPRSETATLLSMRWRSRHRFRRCWTQSEGRTGMRRTGTLRRTSSAPCSWREMR